MLSIAAILFAAGALGGLTLAYQHLTRKTAPIPLALLHGAAVATALVLLIIGISQMAAAGGLLTASLILFIVAALGGFVLFAFFHLRGRPLPAALIVVHGLVAVSGFVLLLAHLAGKG